jgi:FMN phosphatase YigB (HAD superfamily)
MPRQDFSHVTTWVFDLDNTLYPPHMRLFDQIEVKMTDWVMRALQVDARPCRPPARALLADLRHHAGGVDA